MKIQEKTIVDYANDLADRNDLKPNPIKNFIELYQEDNTIPFIARYRKEQIDSMDDSQLRLLIDQYEQLVSLQDRRITIVNTLNTLEIEDEALLKQIESATSLSELEDLYRPYKPKRKTRASIAISRGLQVVADAIRLKVSDENLNKIATTFLKDQKEVEKLKPLETIDEVFAGASDILAQELSDDAKLRGILKKEFNRSGLLISKSKTEEDSVYRLYYNYQEPIKKLAHHRLLAINRGEAQGVLNVSLEIEENDWQKYLFNYFNLHSFNLKAEELLREVALDAYKRLLKPSLDNEIRSDLTTVAHEEALKLFSVNLKNALLVPPMKSKTVLALDPGYRNGCKWAVVDPSGKPLDAGLIFPILFANRLEDAKKITLQAIKKHQVELVVVGNGTASRETEQFLVDLLKENKLNIPHLMVDESGASVYSASPISSEELPEMELNLRSAVSLARRVLDPLAELVKIDPKSIGVGQYQHDMNQKRLDSQLGGVVEGVVNTIGVSLNTASPSLLSYVSGINKTIANNIVKYRNESGRFESRTELKKVKGLGAKAFEQSAGFLRIDTSKEPLDNTFVHPESYKVAKALMKQFNLKFNHDNHVDKELLIDFSNQHEVGLETLNDILEAISKPARDIRDDFPSPILVREVQSIEDLKVNQKLTGVVRNVTAFGAFVDLGIHQDGLVHISQMANKFVKDPTQIVSVGQVVEVRVIEVDVAKKRIALSMKD